MDNYIKISVKNSSCIVKTMQGEKIIQCNGKNDKDSVKKLLSLVDQLILEKNYGIAVK
jgi:hypothetical protein